MLKIHKTSDKLRNLSVGVATFCFTFLAAFFASTNFMPVGDGSAASDVSAFVDSETGYYLNTTSSGNVILDVIATPSGNVEVAKDTLLTKTNSSTGYKLYISMDNSDANGNRLYRDGGSSARFYLSPSSGTATSPVVLGANTWGYALGSSSTIPANTAGNDTDEDVTISAYDTEKTAAENVFSAVPLVGEENLIQSYSQSSSAGVSLDVYYGVNASTALPSGLYQGTIVYTAIAEGEPAASGEVSVSPNNTTTAEVNAGQTVTVATGLYTDMDDLGDVTITFINLNDTDIFGTCNNARRVESDSALVNFTCLMPTNISAGYYNVSVSIPKFGKEYNLDNALTVIPSFYAATTMQDISSDFCSSVKPATTLTTDTATDYSIYLANAGSYVPYVMLEDVRDRTNDKAGTGTMYYVAKLNDGRCWMTNDLKLGGNSDLILTSDTSNVPSEGFTLKAENTGTWCTTSDSTCYHQSLMVKTGVPNGYLYNWYTATASSGTYSTSSGAVSYNICPKGWTLPTGDTAQGSFYYLAQQYGMSSNGGGNSTVLSDLMASPIPGFNYTGDRNGDTLDTTRAGLYWSRTTSDSSRAYYLGFNSAGQLFTQSSYYKYMGYAIRCITAQ